MIDTQAVLDIFFMAITVDNEIHISEIKTIKDIIENSPYKFPDDVDKQIQNLTTKDQEIIKKNFDKAIAKLASEAIEDKRAILRLIMKIVDADNIMHQNEVRLISGIIKEWNIEV